MRNRTHLTKMVDDNKELSDEELVDKLYQYLTGDLKLSNKKAFSVIYFLQEHVPVFPDNIEQCSVCGSIYDSYRTGYHSDLTLKYYCSESCEPRGLHEREQRWEKKKDAPFRKWKKLVKKEQQVFPSLKGKEIADPYLYGYFSDGKSPADAIADILTKITPPTKVSRQ